MRKQPVKLYKYHLLDSNGDVDLEIKIVERDMIKSQMGALKMADIFVYKEVKPMGFELLVRERNNI